jgi:3-oxoacyl-[acyl-carrier protein] reductase
VSPRLEGRVAVATGESKGIGAVTRSLAKELGPRKIRVNSINPGVVETEGVDDAGTHPIHNREVRTRLEAQTSLGRIGQPRDIGPSGRLFRLG